MLQKSPGHGEYQFRSVYTQSVPRFPPGVHAHLRTNDSLLWYRRSLRWLLVSSLVSPGYHALRLLSYHIMATSAEFTPKERAWHLLGIDALNRRHAFVARALCALAGHRRGWTVPGQLMGGVHPAVLAGQVALRCRYADCS